MWADPQSLPPIRAKISPDAGAAEAGRRSEMPMRARKPRRTRVRMNEVKDRVGFLREGLFAKYVVALVGLVVFVLAVNGAIETWITYGGIKRSLADGMSEKAEATAKRIQQSLSDLERQISWVTRASSNTTDLRRADYAQLLRQVQQVSQLSLLNAQGREVLRMTRQTAT